MSQGSQLRVSDKVAAQVLARAGGAVSKLTGPPTPVLLAGGLGASPPSPEQRIPGSKEAERSASPCHSQNPPPGTPAAVTRPARDNAGGYYVWACGYQGAGNTGPSWRLREQPASKMANRTPGAVRVDHGLLLKGSELRVVQKKMKYMWPAKPVFSIRLFIERV